MYLSIHTPEKVIFDGKVSSLSLPGRLGPFQILENHAPIITTLAKGDIRYHTLSGKEELLHVTQGSVMLRKNRVRIFMPY